MVYLGSPKNKDDKAKWQRNWRRKNPKKARRAWQTWEKKTKYNSKENTRRWHLAKYNLTQEEYEGLALQQNYKCAICGNLPLEPYLCIDHNHQTGLIRGLLCKKCNSGLGFFNDNATLISNALEYMKEGESYSI